ncbi:MAG: ribonuclease III domain-containing protein [Oscillospiraceae bacterium]
MNRRTIVTITAEKLDHNARELSPLTLAFVGDGVYEIMVREQMAIKFGSMPTSKLHNYGVKMVKATYQSKVYGVLEEMLTESELSVLKRGRNAHSSTVPKNADPVEYRRATGVESLFGYLYLNGETQRAKELFLLAVEKVQI